MAARAAALLAEVEQRSGVGTWDLDVPAGWVTWSALSARLHGRPGSSGVVLADLLDSYDAAARQQLGAALGQVAAGAAPLDLELPVVRATGPGWVRVTARLAHPPVAGAPRRVLGTVRDVTSAVAERAALQRFRDLVELSEEGIVELGPDARLTYANPRAAAMLGWDPAAMHGVQVWRWLHPDVADPATTARWWREQLLADPIGAGRAEVCFRHRDGHPVWVQLTVKAERDAQGRIHSVRAVVTDLTARKARETELATTRAQLEEAQRLARLGHWQADLTTGELQWSPMVYELLGVDPETFVPTLDAFFDRVHPDDLHLLTAQAEAREPAQGHDLVYRIVREDGEVRSLRDQARAVIVDGWPVGFHGTVQDVTELVRAEQAARASEQMLQRVLTAANDGWWDHDLVAGTAFHSERWWRIHGYEPGELAEDTSLWRSLVLPEELPALDADAQQVAAARQPTFVVRTRVRHRDGHVVPVMIRALVEYSADGEVVRVSGATTDLTEVQHAEQVKEEFVSTVSHELRTPLTSIGGAIELIAAGRTGPITDQTAELLHVAVRNTRRLRRLIDDLLDAEQLMIGRARFEPVRQPLVPLLDRALAETTTYDASGRVRFSPLTVPEELVDVHVDVDAQRLHQVVANYLSNAAKYAPAGSEIDVEVAADDRWVRVDVVDQGDGVPDGFEGRLFHRFQQADPSDERSRGGTGLGLAISRDIIERLNGRVGYEASPGRTCFWFSLPLVD